VKRTYSSDACMTHGASLPYAGFSLLELLIGLSLTVCVALAVAPLWTSLEAKAKADGDRAIVLLQQRVAIARLERDLRAASAAGSLFPASCALLQATPHQIVLLAASASDGGTYLVEWEVTGGAIMRRRGPCPAAIPAAFPHSLYTDSKTMLENVASSTHFVFTSSSGAAVVDPVEGDTLLRVTTVVLQGATRVPGASKTSGQAARFLIACPLGH
jgi:Tfp pilus assembly protein PilV